MSRTVALNLTNVTNELQNVTTWHSLGVQLGIAPRILDEIEDDHRTTARRKSALFKYWLENCPNKSWQVLAGAVENIDQKNLARKLKKYVNAPALNLTNVTNALQNVTNWHSLGVQLGIAPRILDEIEDDHRTTARRKSALFKYWLENCPNKSWQVLAGAVENIDQKNLARKLKKYVNAPETETVPTTDGGPSHIRAHVQQTHATTPFTMTQDGDEVGRRLQLALEEDRKHYDAYQQALQNDLEIPLKYFKLLMFGPPRSGKTSLKKRLLGEIINLTGKAIQPSTGAFDAYNVVLKLAEEKTTSSTTVISGYTWAGARRDEDTDLDEELHLLYRFIVERSIGSESAAEPVPAIEQSVVTNSRIQGVCNIISRLLSWMKSKLSHEAVVGNATMTDIHRTVSDSEMTEIEREFEAFNKVLKSSAGQRQLKVLLEKTILLNMVDTGGQPAFMEILPMLTIGPALYLIFLRLDQELKKSCKLQYVGEDNKEVSLGESSYTLQEVIFQVLSSIVCFRSDTSSAKEENQSKTKWSTFHQSQAVMLVGTYKDQLENQPSPEEEKLSPEEVKSKIKEIDDALKEELNVILNPDDTNPNKDLLRHAFPSDDQLIFDVDNMTGTEDEVKEIRKRLENVISQEFNQPSIPASWLMFSIFLRKMRKRKMSLSQCEEIGRRLNISDVRDAIWFLHHCIGVLLYYPDVQELKDVVICDPQIVFDSVTKLILNTFVPNVSSDSVCFKFKKAGQFSLNDIRQLLKISIKDDILPLPQLVKLLEHLNIIASISFSEENGASSADKSVLYFMPAVLPSAQKDELNVCHGPADPAPLLIRFNSGIVPVGLFCASIACIVARKDQLDWTLMEPKPGKKTGYTLYKNRITFRMHNKSGTCSYDVTLISKPKQYEVHVTLVPEHKDEKPSHEDCWRVLKTVCHTLDHVISKMKHKQYLMSSDLQTQFPYELGFQCPKHPDEEHVAICRHHPEQGDSSQTAPAYDLLLGYFQDKSRFMCLDKEVVANPIDNVKYNLWMGTPDIAAPNTDHSERTHPSSDHSYDLQEGRDGDTKPRANFLGMTMRVMILLVFVAVAIAVAAVANLKPDLVCDLLPKTTTCTPNAESTKPGVNPTLSLQETLTKLPNAETHQKVTTKQERLSLLFQQAPTLPKLTHFKLPEEKYGSGESINVLQEIGDDFQKFGTLLLNDEIGHEVDSIVSKNLENGHESINRDIVKKWLVGKGKQPVTWETLIGVLEDMKHLTLVQKIKNTINS